MSFAADLFVVVWAKKRQRDAVNVSHAQAMMHLIASRSDLL